MEISLSFIGEIPVCGLSGRLDVTSSPVLEERLMSLLTGADQKLIFDCSNLDYVSSAGLRVFLSTQRNLAALGGGIAFAAMSQPVRDLFRLAGLENYFVTGGTPSEAAAILG